MKIKALIRSRVWYPGIDTQVEEMIKRCLICQVNADKPKLEPLKPSPMPVGTWQEVSADFFGSMDTGLYWFVNYCDYSMYVILDAIKSVSMDHVQPVLEKIFSLFGTPKIYKSDNGAPFMSYRFDRFAELWGFKHRKVSPLWPRANGGAESVMPKLSKILRAFAVSGAGREQALQAFPRSYRATPHTTTKVPPAMLFLGFCNLSGIPKMNENRENIESQHRWATENDLDDQVLLRWRRTKKAMSM